MIKLSTEQAYVLGIKLAMEELGLEFDPKMAQMPPPMAAAAGPMMGAGVNPTAQPARPIPQGMQPMQGAAPGSFQNPKWKQQAMPSKPLPMRPTLRS